MGSGGQQRSITTTSSTASIYYDTKQEAALAYDKKARQCLEDKLLNYDSIKAAEEAAVQAQAEYILVHEMCAGPQQPKPRPASGFYGVSADKKRWRAQLNYDSKKHHLGIFDTKQEAALAYDRAAKQCGKDKLLNYESMKEEEEAAAQAQAEIYADALCAGPQQPKPRPASGSTACLHVEAVESADQLRQQETPPWHLRHHAGGSTRIRQGSKAVRQG
jgi:hypothetical protein